MAQFHVLFLEHRAKFTLLPTFWSRYVSALGQTKYEVSQKYIEKCWSLARDLKTLGIGGKGLDKAIGESKRQLWASEALIEMAKQVNMVV